MKKLNLFGVIMMLVIGINFASCSSDDDNSSASEEYSEDLFAIEGATFHEGELPEATTTDEIEGVSFNNRALSGGMNFIVINGDKAYQKFYVGTTDSDGYWEYIPSQSRSNTTNLYSIPIMYGTNYNKDITMVLIGVDEEGNVTVQYQFDVTFVDSESGDININLTFSTPKDVDLHLYTPSGEHIYYGHRGGNVTIGDETIAYGLDHDSNAGCSLDYLNNENIYIPEELVENGEYRVVVDLWGNCTNEYATSWAVVTRYKGNILNNELSGWTNPATGTYAADARSGDMTHVMTFTISDAKEARSAKSYKITPRELTEAEKAKIEFALD